MIFKQIWNSTIFFKWASYVENFLRNICRVFETAQSILISPPPPNEQLLQVQPLPRFPEWSNLRLEENPPICCCFHISTKLNAHFGLRLNKQCKDVKYIKGGLKRDLGWTVVQHTLQDILTFEELLLIFFFFLSWKLSVVIIIPAFLPFCFWQTNHYTPATAWHSAPRTLRKDISISDNIKISHLTMVSQYLTLQWYLNISPCKDIWISDNIKISQYLTLQWFLNIR